MTLTMPFDGIATDYDRSFTKSAIGQRMRSATWRRLDASFQPGDRVLELNCGTGEDALHLAQRGVRVLATDSSATMLGITLDKVERAGLTGLVDVARLAIEDLGNGGAGRVADGCFDGVLSNFGGLNCVDDLSGVARSLAAMIRPGGRALLCIMGPAVPWEWAWFLAQGHPRKALRRLGRDGAHWRGLTIRYPSIGSVRRAFSPHFAQRRVSALGALIPPPYAESWATRHPAALAMLDRWERRVETIPPLPWLADHFLLELERVQSGVGT